MNEVKGCVSPLGAVKGGQLEFVRGAANVAIHADPEIEDLYRAHFEGTVPEVDARNGVVTVKYPWTLHPFDWRKRKANVVLNARVPWRIVVGGGGLSKLEADLGGLRLSSFEVEGGASRVERKLPEPSGTVPVRVDGGASDVTILRPAAVAACVQVGAEPASWR